MKRETFKILVEKYLQGSASEAEQQELFMYYDALQRKELNWNVTELGDEATARQRLYANILQEIADKEQETIVNEEEFTENGNTVPNVVKLWSKLKIWVAAAAVLLMIGTALFYYNSTSRNNDQEELAASHIAPGKNTATLTLANGKIINLSDAKTGVIINASNNAADITYNDGSKVQVSSGSQSLGSLKSEQSITGPVGDPSLYNEHPSNERPSMNGRHPGIGRDPALAGNTQLLTAATPRGGQYTITLPDGTKVWLNAESSIKFPSTFSGLPNRTVELFGEAYFEVSKVYLSSKQRMPFIVKTNKQEVEVLGTHFNINSYANEVATKTTLFEGSVRVAPLSSRMNLKKEEVTLKPGQQSSLIPTSKTIKVTEVDTEEIIAWKNGLFTFNSEPLESIMKKLARWYNIDIQYQNNEIKSQTFSGTVSRFANISIILKRLEVTGNIKFRVEGRKIIIKEN